MLISVAISEIRRGLGRPHEGELSDADILLELWQSIAFYRSLLNLADTAWSVQKWEFTVPPQTPTELNLTAGDFGIGIFLTTKNDSDPYFIRRTIEIVSLEKMSLYYSGPANLPMGGAWNLPHVARVFSIYNQLGQWKIAWMPAHQSAADYTLWYVAGVSTMPPIFDGDIGLPVEEASWIVVNDVICNIFPQIADAEEGLNKQQQFLFEIAKSKVQQWSPIFEARRWDGATRENIIRRRIFGHPRSKGPGMY